MPQLRCPDDGRFLLQLGMYVTKKGYWRYSCSEYRDQYVHRVMMEHHLGRKLRDNEVVHHRDGNGLNNEEHYDGKWNLELMDVLKHNAASAAQYWFLKMFVWPLEKKQWDEYHANVLAEASP